MGDVDGAALTSRARRGGDAGLIETDEERLTGDADDPEMAVLREPGRDGSVDLDVERSCPQRLFEAVTQPADATGRIGAIGDGHLHRSHHADDAGHVLGAGATAELLTSAVEHGFQLDAVPHVQQPDTLGTAELVCCERQEVAGRSCNRHVTREERLHCIRVHEHLAAASPDCSGDVGDGLDDTRLVVGIHDRCDRRGVVHGSGDLGGLDPPEAIHADDRNTTTEAAHEVGRLEHGLVLRGDGHHSADRFAGERAACDGEVVGLRSATREHDLEGTCRTEELGGPFPRLFEGVLGATRYGMEARGIAVGVVQERRHRLSHFGTHRGGGRMVEIDRHRRDRFSQPAATTMPPTLFDMRSVQLVEPGTPLVNQQGPALEPGPTDVVVAVEAAGICRSDVHYRAGFPTTAFLPITLGHEVAGTIVACGSEVASGRLRERVALHYQTSCGTCEFCTRGHEQFCPDGEMLGKSRHGGYAEQVVVPAGNAYPVPDDVSAEQAAVMMCSTATAFHALRKGRLIEGERVAVLGTGGLGMSAVQLARELGAGVVYAVDIDRDRLALAQAHGAVPVAADAVDVGARLQEEGGVDVALDLLGSVELVRIGMEALRPLGRMVAVGLVDDAVAIRPYEDLIIGERELIGCSDHLGAEIPELLEMASQRRIDVASVITDRVPLDAGAIDTAMDRLERFRGGVRTVIDVAGSRTSV